MAVGLECEKSCIPIFYRYSEVYRELQRKQNHSFRLWFSLSSLVRVFTLSPRNYVVKREGEAMAEEKERERERCYRPGMSRGPRSRVGVEVGV